MLDDLFAILVSLFVATTPFTVVPLGVPIIVGPAAMTACVTLAEGYGTFVTLVGLVLNLGLTAILLHNGHVVRKVISPGVAGAIGKVMSLFLAGITVAMIRSGITAMVTVVGG